jgi:hypothetical protein
MDSTQTFNEFALTALTDSSTAAIKLAQEAINDARAADFPQAAHFLKEKRPEETILGELHLCEKILCLAAISLLRKYNIDTGPHSYDLVTASRFDKRWQNSTSEDRGISRKVQSCA